jgi:hypothetical protein
MDLTVWLARRRMHMRSPLLLLAILGASQAAANTYYKCVDGKGSVTVQQTACAVSSSQEERKVWTSRTSATPATAESATPGLRLPEKSEKQERK